VDIESITGDVVKHHIGSMLALTVFPDMKLASAKPLNEARDGELRGCWFPGFSVNSRMKDVDLRKLNVMPSP